MKNLAIRIFFAIFAITSIDCHAQEVLENDRQKFLEQFNRAKEEFPSTLQWNLDKHKSIEDFKNDFIVLTGKKDAVPMSPGTGDCFVYVGGASEKGRFYFLSTKSEVEWECIHNPDISVIRDKHHGASRPRVILSIFEFEPPSHEFFFLPLVLQSDDGRNFYAGELDKCADRNLKKVDLQHLWQLRRAVNECRRSRSDIPQKPSTR